VGQHRRLHALAAWKRHAYGSVPQQRRLDLPAIASRRHGVAVLQHDLDIQKDSPGKDKDANWLPAPAGEFHLTMRMYWPGDKAPSIIDGSWRPPAVKKVD
jgi:hypothetical protein